MMCESIKKKLDNRKKIEFLRTDLLF